MSEFFSCWILQPHLFFSFFKKYPTARKLLAAALTGFPPRRLLSVLWYPGSMYPGGFCLQVRPDSRAPFVLEIVPAFLSEAPPDDSPDLSGKRILPASFYGENPSLTSSSPAENFLRIFLTFQESEQKNPFFYGSFVSPAPPVSCRILNLSALQPSLSAFPDLYAFSRFLLVRHSSELSPLARRFPVLSDTAPFLEELLREQELRALFEKTPHFVPEDSHGISAMCSVNRLLIREKRFDELLKVSDDPEALRNLFQEFRARGFFAYEKDPCRLHRSQEKREKYI